MKCEIDDQLLGTDCLQLNGSNPAMVSIETPSPRQGQPSLDRERSEASPEHPEPGMPLADVVEQGGPHCCDIQPPGAGYLAGLVPVTLVDARL
jgi:hypothetical protein